VPIALVAVLIMGGSAYYVTKQHIIRTVRQDIKTLGFEAAQSIANHLRQRSNDLDALTETPFFANHFNNVEFGLLQEAEAYRREIEKYLAAFSRRTGAYSGIYYLNADGSELARVERSEVQTRGARPAVAEAAARVSSLARDDKYISDPVDLPDLGPTMFYAKGLYNDAGQQKGAVVLGASLFPVQAVLARLQAASAGSARLVNESGALVQLWSATQQGPTEDKDFSRFLIEVPESDWNIEVATNLDNFLGPLKRIRAISAILILVVGFAAGVIIYTRIRRLIRPIQTLVTATESLAEGNLATRVPVTSNDEIGLLSTSFNSMIDALQTKAEQERKLQTQLIHSEKLTVVGLLVSGVAHELNNPLTSVVGYSELLALEKNLPQAVKDDLAVIHENALLCRDIVGNLLRFARKGRGTPVNVDLNAVVKSAQKLMAYRLKRTENVEITCDLDPALPPVLADFQQIEQVLLNLLSNACDAMTDRTDKRVRVETRQAGGQVTLRFSDNGPGIPAPIRETIFEAFFTTKAEGKGTGLGLAISREILEQNGGTLAVEPPANPESGALFVLRLPVAPGRDVV